MRAMKKFLLC